MNLQHPMTADDVERLREEYLRLVRRDLPAAARSAVPAWPIRSDHCFMRVVLDNVLGRCWYDALDRKRPAYRQLSADQLRAAVDLARQMLRDPPSVERLNRRSLALRGKA